MRFETVDVRFETIDVRFETIDMSQISIKTQEIKNPAVLRSTGFDYKQ